VDHRANGVVWIIGRSETPGGYNIFYWNGANWNYVDGGATNITVDGKGRPIVSNNAQNIFARFGATLVAGNSRKCADVYAYSTANGGSIVQWSCHGQDNQRWTPLQMNDGSFVFVSGHSGKCLDVSGWSTADGAPLQQWDCHWGDNQRFWLEAVGSGWRLRPKHSGKCVDVSGWSTADGAGLQQWSCHGGSNQTFYFR
jgi:hypothetical protein